MKNLPAIAIHGGAGTLLRSNMSPEKEQAYRVALEAAVVAGFRLLQKGESSLTAAIAAVVELENCELFNAGKGAVFNAEGKHEMEASVMDGSNRQAGAAALVQNIKNPVILAAEVLANTEHVMLAGSGAEAFAQQQGLEFMPDDYFFNQLRYDQWQEIKGTSTFKLDHSDQEIAARKMGTVGAVAVDVNGHVAAATSTGGMTNKMPGRVGDTPLIGGGTYAYDKTCAVSCTGSGEFFMRGVAAYDVSCLMEYKGLSLQAACDEVILKRMVELGGDGGLVAVNSKGEIAMPINCDGMYRAWQIGDQPKESAIFKD